MITNKYGLLILTLLLSYGCEQKTGDADSTGQAAVTAYDAAPVADTLLVNGRVYTVDPAQPWAEAIAVRDSRILFVGSDDEAAAYQGDQTEVIDMNGKMAMPGLNDLHVHPVYGFTVQLFECVFPGTATPEVVRQTVTQCVADYPDAEWIIGGQWETDFFIKHDIPSPRKWLDEISGDKAVLLRDTSFHNRWANSKALELAGLTRDSPEIPGGEMVRDKETGEPNGLLYEAAAGPVLRIIPDWTEEQYLASAREGVRAANRFGLTGIKEAWATPQGLKAYKTLDENREVSVHLVTSMSVLPMLDEEKNLDAEILEQMRTAHRGRNVNTDAVKISMDGVP
ncbi:MAG: amidohydrolase family protein, partial [Gammaproteobacteria bacterium]|nr:amidohydrolase family protein [Gammaproteobacteria bacterium]